MLYSSLEITLNNYKFSNVVIQTDRKIGLEYYLVECYYKYPFLHSFSRYMKDICRCSHYSNMHKYHPPQFQRNNRMS